MYEGNNDSFIYSFHFVKIRFFHTSNVVFFQKGKKKAFAKLIFPPNLKNYIFNSLRRFVVLKFFIKKY